MSEREETYEIDLEALLTRMIDFAQFTATSRKISICKNFNGKLPLLRSGLVNIKQVFLNVILNAIQQIDKFIRLTGDIEVSTTLEHDGSLPVIKVRIKDTGIGIHHKDFERIFKPLYTTRKGGHGMGLAISRSAMESLGGSIAVEESLLYEGTTFVMSFSTNTYKSSELI
ncbi:MAG: hypothetical protein GY816_22715 [Cytophagales bacterium]|nr:hypothetical protein [Cytophagales bacterium]